MTEKRESRPDKVEAAPQEFGGSDTNSTKAKARSVARPSTPKISQRTENEILAQVTADYVSSLDRASLPAPATIERELLAQTNFAFGAENMNRVPGNKITLLKTLHFTQVAQLLVSLHHVVKVAPSGKNSDPDFDLLAIYSDEGPSEGT